MAVVRRGEEDVATWGGDYISKDRTFFLRDERYMNGPGQRMVSKSPHKAE